MELFIPRCFLGLEGFRGFSPALHADLEATNFTYSPRSQCELACNTVTLFALRATRRAKTKKVKKMLQYRNSQPFISKGVHPANKEIDMTTAETPQVFAERFLQAIQDLPVKNTPNARAVRRKFSKQLKDQEPDFVLQVARILLSRMQHRWMADELIIHHKPAFNRLDAHLLEELGQGLNSWDTVDSFGRGLSGPAWLKGQIEDETIQNWAQSPILWWRRAALVSTVALNKRINGGTGDVARTLSVCRILAADPEDMVVKALSWALRELVIHNPQAVQAFLAENELVLAARVKREVRNKLETGLKNPSRAK